MKNKNIRKMGRKLATEYTEGSEKSFKVFN